MVLLLPAAGFGDSSTMGWGGKGKGLNMGFLQQLSQLFAGQSAAEVQAFFQPFSPAKGKGKSKGQDSQEHRGKGTLMQPAAWPIPKAPVEEEGWIRPKRASPPVMGLNGKPDTMTHPSFGTIVSTAFLCHQCLHKHCSNNRSHCANINCGIKRDRTQEPSTVPKKGAQPNCQPGLGGKGGRVNPTLVVKKPPKAPANRAVQLAESPPGSMEDEVAASVVASSYVSPVLLKPGNLRSCVFANIGYAIEVDKAKGPAQSSPDNGAQRAELLAKAQKRLTWLTDDEPEWKADTIALIAKLQEAEPPNEHQENHNLAALAMIQATHLKDMGLAAAAFQEEEASLKDEMALLQMKIADHMAERTVQLATDTKFAAQLAIKCTKVIGPEEPDAEALPSPQIMEHLFSTISQQDINTIASTISLLPEHVALIMTSMQQAIVKQLQQGPSTADDVTMEGPSGIDIPVGAHANGDDLANGSSS